MTRGYTTKHIGALEDTFAEAMLETEAVTQTDTHELDVPDEALTEVREAKRKILAEEAEEVAAQEDIRRHTDSCVADLLEQYETNKTAVTVDMEVTEAEIQREKAEVLAQNAERAKRAQIASVGKDRISVFRSLQSQIPRTELNLPKYFYRPDMIPEDFYHNSETQKERILELASITIQYREGFPTFNDGTAIWSQMAHESDQDFDLFNQYLSQGEVLGARRTELVAEGLYQIRPKVSNEDPQLSRPDLSTYKQRVIELFAYYFWKARAQAFDLFQAAASKKLKEHRIASITNDHALQAEKLKNMVMGYFCRVNDAGDPIWLENANPSNMARVLDLATKLQRLSSGLSPVAPSVEEANLASHGSFDSTMRAISLQAGEVTTRENTAPIDLDKVLQTPDVAVLAQQIQISYRDPKQKNLNLDADTEEGSST